MPLVRDQGILINAAPCPAYSICLNSQPHPIPCWSEASLGTIESHLHNPIPLADLMGSVNADYGLVALAVCQGIADADQTITSAEEAILQTLKAQFQPV